jgi:dTDP-4-amino-4,6-dideoxygalactose transaminase
MTQAAGRATAASGTRAKVVSDGSHKGSFRIPLARPSLPPLAEYVALLEQTWTSRRLSNGGPHVKALEAALEAYLGPVRALAVANCDLALTLAVSALGLTPGTLVLLPSYAFPSTLHAVLWNRLSPRFVDVSPASFCIDPEALATELDERVGLVVATHAFGAACELPALERLCERVGAALIVDGAQALGTLLNGRHVASWGTATALSFSATKVATSGEGGALATASPELAERVERLRAYGRVSGNESVVATGLNAKLSELQAALGCLTVERLQTELAARDRLSVLYAERLAAVEAVRLQSSYPGERPSRTLLAADFGPYSRAVERRLEQRGIETRRYFRPLHENPLYERVPRTPLPVSERLGRDVLCLPLYAELEAATVEEICIEIAAAVGGEH